ncbi:MAG: hypothetical protein EA412_06675 [Chitinophagaceae bacterium]|nr:MAG: hypothetical protein EA412_06675 [Chitinophagaceae bacterium]
MKIAVKIFLLLILSAEIFSQSQFLCKGDSINLVFENDKIQDFEWQKSTDNINWEKIGENNLHSIVDYPTENTWYRVKALDQSCPEFSYSDEQFIEVYELSKVLQNDTLKSCLYDTVKLLAADIVNASYNWSGPNQFSSKSNNPLVADSAMNIHSGEYILEVIKNTCHFTFSQHVIIQELPQIPQPKNNGPLCQGDQLELTIENIESGVDYTWIDPQNNETNALSVEIDTFYYMDNIATFNVFAEKYGCLSSIQSTEVIMQTTPLAPIESQHLAGTDYIHWHWEESQVNSSFRVNHIDDYSTSTDIGNINSYNLVNLDCDTVYELFVWEYNECGVSASAVFSKSTNSCPAGCGGVTSIVDIDGNSYGVVEIGTQCWMSENLNTITHTHGNSWCYDHDSLMCDSYGRLYDWEAIMAGENSSNQIPSGVQGICPDGWHVPSDNEWKELEVYLGMCEGNTFGCADATGWRGFDIGSQLAGTYNLWHDGQLKSHNRFNFSGFNGLPGGYRFSTACAQNVIGHYGFWWTATEINTNAWTRHLDENLTSVNRNGNNKNHGFSIRCIKD